MGIRIAFVIAGVVLIVFSFRKHCRKKLLVNYAVLWSFLGAALILAGIFPIVLDWTDRLGSAAKWTVFGAGALLLAAGMYESLLVSQIKMNGQELAMQVALLRQENENMRAEIQRLAMMRRESDAEEDLIRY